MKLNYLYQMIFLSILFLTGCQIDPETMRKIENIQAQHQQKMRTMNAVQSNRAGIDDSAAVVYVDMINNNAQIATVSPDGKDSKLLTSDVGYKSRPAWSQDHKKIAFFHYESDRPIDQYVSVTVINADGTGQHEVVNKKKIDTKKARISWHPDGEMIYIQEQDFPAILFGYNVNDGKQVDTIRLPKQTFMTELHTISPNMQFMAGAGPSKQDGIWHIGTIRKDGKKETDLMKPFNNVSYHIGTVVWAYSSDMVAFELDKIIMVMSSSMRIDFKFYQITPQDFNAELSQPAISPSGQKIIAVMEKTQEGHRGSGDAEVISNLWIMNIDGTKQSQLTQSGTAFDPHW